MPITLVCESDIKPNERALLLDLFKSCGYNRFKVVEYNTFIENYLRSSLGTQYACDDVLVAWTEGADLTFTLFNLHRDSERRQEYYPGLGVDPRLKHVKNLIWERIKGQNPWLNFSVEEETISKAASDFLTSSTPLINDTLILSDGISYHYSLNRRLIDNLQCSEGVAIRSKLEDFLRENNVSNRNKILLLLRGVAAGNMFFEQTICQGFTNTIRSDRKLRNNTMQLLIADPNPVVAQEPTIIINEYPLPPVEGKVNGEVGIVEFKKQPNKDIGKRELRRKWREINAQASGMSRDGRSDDALSLLYSFRKECSTIDGTDELISEIDLKISSLDNGERTSKPTINITEVKGIEREWRELRATAKGKVRNGQTGGVIRILNNFIQRISTIPGAEKVKEAVIKELSVLSPNTVPSKNASKHFDGEIHPNGKWVWVSSAAGGKGDWRTLGGRVHQQAIESVAETKCTSINEGQKLIAAGKLKEARDWYRASGNASKAKILSDLIRSQKGVELRKGSLEECKHSKNIEQIKRIITELQNYISKCNEVNYDCAEYKKLLSEYKKLIK